MAGARWVLVAFGRHVQQCEAYSADTQRTVGRGAVSYMSYPRSTCAVAPGQPSTTSFPPLYCRTAAAQDWESLHPINVGFIQFSLANAYITLDRCSIPNLAERSMAGKPTPTGLGGDRPVQKACTALRYG